MPSNTLRRVGIAVPVCLLVLGILFSAGPEPTPPRLKAPLPDVPDSLQVVERWLTQREQAHAALKPDNAARIVWADSIPSRTQWCVVYLHGFSASHHEGAPAHTRFAQRYGCNLLLTRLHRHGLDTPDVFIDLTAESYLNSAREALALGRRLGGKVLLMGTSTGATLALTLAAQYPSIVGGLILYSPNVALADPASEILTLPWGLHIARAVLGSKYRSFDADPQTQRFWTHRYRIEGLVAMQQLLETTMTESTFENITQPAFVGYYYKNDQEKDDIISIPALKTMFGQLGTPPSQKQIQTFPDAGDHVIAGSIKSHAADEVLARTCAFAEQVLGWQPVETAEGSTLPNPDRTP